MDNTTPIVQLPLIRMVDLAINPDGSVNSPVLQTVLHALVQKTDAQQVKVEIHGAEAVALQKQIIGAQDKLAFSLQDAIGSGDHGKEQRVHAEMPDMTPSQGSSIAHEKVDELESNMMDLMSQWKELRDFAANSGIFNALSEEKTCVVIKEDQLIIFEKRFQATEKRISRMASTIEKLKKYPKDFHFGRKRQQNQDDDPASKTSTALTSCDVMEVSVSDIAISNSYVDRTTMNSSVLDDSDATSKPINVIVHPQYINDVSISKQNVGDELNYIEDVVAKEDEGNAQEPQMIKLSESFVDMQESISRNTPENYEDIWRKGQKIFDDLNLRVRNLKMRCPSSSKESDRSSCKAAFRNFDHLRPLLVNLAEQKRKLIGEMQMIANELEDYIRQTEVQEAMKKDKIEIANNSISDVWNEKIRKADKITRGQGSLPEPGSSRHTRVREDRVTEISRYKLPFDECHPLRKF